MALITVAVVAVSLAPMAWANGAANGIANSPHDFSNENWNNTGEICRTCHVPHDHGRDTGLVGLLWNHALPDTTGYVMYSSSSLDGAADTEPTGISKMCLGCHDGTVALDEFDSNVGTPGTTFIGSGDQVPNLPGSPQDLRATHPISIVYDISLDQELNDPDTTQMGASGRTISAFLENGKVQCSSCHDVHDSPTEAVAGTKLLREAQTAGQGGSPSGLCLTCHNK